MQDLLSIETSNYSICHQDVVEMKFKEKKKSNKVQYFQNCMLCNNNTSVKVLRLISICLNTHYSVWLRLSSTASFVQYKYTEMQHSVMLRIHLMVEFKSFHDTHIFTCCLSARGGLGRKPLLLLLWFQSHQSFSGCSTASWTAHTAAAILAAWIFCLKYLVKPDLLLA